MSQNNNHISVWRCIDYQVIIIYLSLVFWGWATIYSASYDFEQTNIFNVDIASGRQSLWMGLSFLIAIVIMLIDAKWYQNASYPIFVTVMLLLLLTVFLAPDIKGSRSWLVLGPIRFQPAEFAKFATALALSKYIGTNGLHLKESRRDYLTFLIILLPMLLIFMQKETGSALVYLSMFVVLYREGMSGIFLFVGICAVLYFIIALRFDGDVYWDYTNLGHSAVLFIIAVITIVMLAMFNRNKKELIFPLVLINLVPLLLAIVCNAYLWHFNIVWVQLLMLVASGVYVLIQFVKKEIKKLGLILAFMFFSVGFLYATDYVFEQVMQPHQQVRVKVLLGLVDDPTGDGYNVNQAKISIGSGGFWGKGFLNGTQTKLKYVPEQDTDFIFCTVGEEKGFFGSAVLVLVYVYLLIRLILMAERQRNRFVRVYGYCVTCIFFFHILINLGMVLGLMPVIGIPLPFFSYGGSSLLSFTVLLFIFLRLDADRMRRT